MVSKNLTLATTMNRSFVLDIRSLFPTSLNHFETICRGLRLLKMFFCMRERDFARHLIGEFLRIPLQGAPRFAVLK